MALNNRETQKNLLFAQLLRNPLKNAIVDKIKNVVNIN